MAYDREDHDLRELKEVGKTMVKVAAMFYLLVGVLFIVVIAAIAAIVKVLFF